MSDTSEREWRFYLDDMIECANKVMFYTEGFDRAGFMANGLAYDATLRNLELIGEAATHIPETIRAAHPEIPWRMIRDLNPVSSPLSRLASSRRHLDSV